MKQTPASEVRYRTYTCTHTRGEVSVQGLHERLDVCRVSACTPFAGTGHSGFKKAN